MVSQVHSGVGFAHPEHTLDVSNRDLMSSYGVGLSSDVLIEVGDLVRVALVQARSTVPLGVNYILAKEILL